MSWGEMWCLALLIWLELLTITVYIVFDKFWLPLLEDISKIGESILLIMVGLQNNTECTNNTYIKRKNIYWTASSFFNASQFLDNTPVFKRMLFWKTKW
jgi:hypothetical protein